MFWLQQRLFSVSVVGIVLFQVAVVSTASDVAEIGALRKALTFYASFDDGVDADLALGDRHLYTADRYDGVPNVRRGLDAGDLVRRQDGAGIGNGSALRFDQRDAPVVFFRGQRNVVFEQSDWSGSVSLWMRVDPHGELGPGFSDPLQITTRKWNNAAFFVDFDKEGVPRPFRLGVFSDLDVWNPTQEEVAPDQLPLITVAEPPFRGDRWTHVAFTWQHFNTGKDDARADFYVDGVHVGTMDGKPQTMTWNADEQLRIFLGISYVGWIDDVACFNRPLQVEEVRAVREAGSQLKPN